MTIARRSLYTGRAVALAGAAGPIAPLVEGVSPDAELLRLGALREQAKAERLIHTPDPDQLLEDVIASLLDDILQLAGATQT